MPTSPATFTSTPQAKDDLFTNTGLTEDSLSGVKLLDVIGNDLGTGNTLYSLADGKGESDNRSKALSTQDAVGAVNLSALGAKIWITEEGKVAYDASALSTTQFQSLAAGQSATDSFTYAIKLSNGMLSWATAKVQITGINDAPVIDLSSLTIDGDSSSGKVTGTLLYTDPDKGDQHSATKALSPLVSSAGAPNLSASLGQALRSTINDEGENGKGALKWNFALPSATPKLATGQAVLANYQLSIADNHGGNSAAQDIGILVVGTGATPKVYSVAARANLAEQAGQTGSTALDQASGTLSGNELGLEDKGGLTSALVMTSWSTGATIPSAAATVLASAITTSTVPTSKGGESEKSIAWQFSAQDKTFDFLAAGQTLTLAYRISSAKEEDGKAKIITLTVTGTNDAPVITNTAAALAGAVKEDATLTATGQLSASDVDHGATQTWSVQGAAAGTYGSVAVNATGKWTYNLNNAATNVQALAAGETHTETFTVRVTDDQGAAVDQGVTVTVTGTNDAPLVATADVTGAVTEQVTPAGNLTDSGTLAFTDVDLTDAHSISAVTPSAGALGTLTASVSTDTTGSGTGGVVTWNYNLADSAVEYLAAGQTKVEAFSFNVLDGQGGSVERTVSVTVTGTNDAPVITNTATALLGAVQEDTTLTATGQLSASDVDNGATQTWSVQGAAAGTYGSLAVNATGKWTYALDNAAHQNLASGETHTETFTVRVTDDQGAAVDQSVTVTLTGTNDAPLVATADVTGAVTEQVTPTGNVTDSGAISFSDLDLTDVHLASAAPVGTTLGSLSAVKNTDTTGSGTGGQLTWTYSVAASAVEYLATGQTKLESFTVTLDDQNGGVVSRQVDVTLTGTNDAPVITSTAQSGAVSEAANNSADEINNVSHQATGTLAFTDVDLVDVHGVSVSGNANPGYRGTLSANIANSATGDGAGSIGWTFAVADAALDDLAQGQTLTQTYSVAVSDGHGGTSSQNVVITITGAADNVPPVVTGAVTLAPIAEDTGARLITQDQLLANSSDVDGPSLTAINLAISAGNGSLSDNGNGTWNYTPALNDDTAVTFSYSVTDGVAAPVATSATLDITPVNDAPVNTVPVGAPAVPSPFSGPAIADPLSGTGQLIGPYSDSQNLASVTNGAAVAVVSSVLSGYAALHDAAGINDGYYGNASSWIPNSPGWLKIDLGQVKLFDTLTFGRDRLGVYNDRAPGTYTISVATTDAYATGNITSDASEYTTVFNGTVNGLSFLQTIVNNFTPVNARYIKIDFTNGGVAVDEVQVYSVNPTAEDTAKVFSVANGNAISISDVDVGAGTEKVTLSVTNGTLTLAGTSGLGFTAGDGSSDTTMTFSGTTTAINTALNGLSYAPTANFNGNATLAITTNDRGNTGTDPGLTDGPSSEEDTDTVAITVTAVNDAPVAVANTISISEDTATAGLAATLIANDIDADGDTLTITAVANATNGSIALNGGNPIFTPTANFSGPASFSYTISDGHGGTATATATVNVAPVADMPSLTLNGTTASGNVGTVIMLPLMTALPSVDTDGSESLRVVLSDFPVGTTFLGGQLNADGITWRITSAFGVPNLATQPLQMTLPAGYNGTFTLHVQAATLDQMTSFPNSQAITPMQDIIVTVAPVNVAPVAVADTLAATEDTPVTYTAAQLLANDTDVDNTNAQLSIASVTSGTGGTAVLNAGGTVTFTPSANFNGPASFTYKASDGAAQSNSATVTMNVAAVNDAPVAVADTLSATEDTQVIYTAAQLLGNDTDVDNTNAQLSIASVTSGTGGTAVLNGNGTVTFTPSANFNGPASFTYTARDGSATSNSATVTVNVAAVNDNPTVTAGAQSVQLVELGVVVGTASANRTLTKGDVDSGDTALYDGAALTTGGWATSNGGSTYTMTGTYGTATLTTGTNVVSYALDNADTDTNGLAANAGVSDPFTVYVKDGSTGTVSTAVNFAITGTNDAPTNLALSANTIVENLPGATIGLLSASDPDAGATLTYTIRAGFDGALFVISGDELRVGSAGLDYEASPTRTVTVRATDNNGAFVDSDFAINVVDRAEATLTTGTDIVPASSDNTQILGFSATLNASDNLDGGSGTDSLVLYGAGTFNLRTLAAYTGIEQVQLVNFTGTQAELYLRDNTTTEVTSIGSGQTFVHLQGSAAATNLVGGDGVNIYYFEGTGRASSIQMGLNNDQVYFWNASAWNPNITIDGGSGGSDFLDFRVANTTYNLQSATLTNLEQINLNNSNITALIDADVIAGVTSMNGSAGSSFVTADTALNLTGKSVNTVTVQSTNAAGTVFTVNSSATAFQVFGGPGSDTIQTSSFAFTAAQRDAIFATASIETIIDTSGTYPAPALPANTYRLTGGTDVLTLTAADETINGSSVTFNTTDNLNGGGGTDTLALYGGGSFNLRTLAAYTGIEQVQLVNYTNLRADLVLRDGTTSIVTASGTGPVWVDLQGTSAASSIQGGAGGDLFYFEGTGTASSVLMGANTDQIYFFNTAAWNANLNITINGEGGTDYLLFYMSNTTVDLRSANLTNVELLYAQGSNLAVQIDADAIANVTTFNGASSSKFVTADTALDLTNKSVSTVTVQSTNAAGTVFTVNSSATAFQVFGGPGSDTIQTSSFAFTAAQRDAIFATASIETIIDTSGTYPAPALPANTYKLTGGTDVLTLTAADETINGSSVTFNTTDNLNGGGGTDTLALYGGGSFNLRTLAAYTGIEQVQLVNYTNLRADLVLRDGTTSAVTASGTGPVWVDLQGTSAASSIQGGAGGDLFYFEGTGTASSVFMGANNDQMYVFNLAAWNANLNITINGEGGTDILYLYMNNATIDLRSATLSNLEVFTAQGSGLTVQIDADAIAGVTQFSGVAGDKFVTADTALDLTNKSVSTVTIESTNATGTTFTVNSTATAFQVLGGPGSDTIETSSFAFTVAQRDAIFNGSFVDIIRDTTGFYGNGAANAITGTAAADNIQAGGGNDRLIGAGGADVLTGGAGGDTFVYQLLSDRGTTGDVITDFTKAGGDVLDLHDVLGTFAGITPTTHANAFSGGFLQFVDSNGATAGGDTLVQVDSDGSGDGWTTLATLSGVVLLPTDLPNFVL